MLNVTRSILAAKHGSFNFRNASITTGPWVFYYLRRCGKQTGTCMEKGTSRDSQSNTYTGSHLLSDITYADKTILYINCFK